MRRVCEALALDDISAVAHQVTAEVLTAGDNSEAWWGLQGKVPSAPAHTAEWPSLAIALDVLPILVPPVRDPGVRTGGAHRHTRPS